MVPLVEDTDFAVPESFCAELPEVDAPEPEVPESEAPDDDEPFEESDDEPPDELDFSDG